MQKAGFYDAWLRIACLIFAAACTPRDTGSQATTAPAVLLDVSGLSWVTGDRFLAVHDSKSPGENDRPRVSILSLPDTAASLTWETLDMSWPPPLGFSSDLESVARIPGTDIFLLVESGEGLWDGQQYRRIHQVRLDGSRLSLVNFAELPATVRNIEGVAVTRSGQDLVLLFAERAEGEPTTNLVWASLKLEPLELGPVQSVSFTPEGLGRPGWRPVTAIETDSAGRVFIASAFDSGDDNGPFQSVIWLAGRVASSSNGIKVVLSEQPERLSTLDGFKVESLAMRRAANGEQLFAGTDDENYGGTIRLIPVTGTLEKK